MKKPVRLELHQCHDDNQPGLDTQCRLGNTRRSAGREKRRYFRPG